MRILIVEGENILAEMLKRRLLRILGTRVTLLKIVRSAIAAQCFIQEHPIDLLLLRPELRTGDGFALLDQPMARGFQTIIMSTNPDEALRGFEYSVLDFLPIPYTEKRLTDALGKLIDRNAWKFRPDCLAVPDGYSLELVPWGDIASIRRAGKEAIVHLKGRACRVRKSLRNLEDLLPDSFLRIHRSHILNLNFLARIDVRSGGCYGASLTDGTRLPIGRTYYPTLKDLFKTA